MRLPTIKMLSDMNEQNRNQTLSVMAQDLSNELKLFDERSITLFNDSSLTDERRKVKRKLDRLKLRAKEFNLHV